MHTNIKQYSQNDDDNTNWLIRATFCAVAISQIHIYQLIQS